MGLFFALNAAFNVRVRIIALPDIPLKTFTKLPQIVPAPCPASPVGCIACCGKFSGKAGDGRRMRFQLVKNDLPLCKANVGDWRVRLH